MLNWWVKLSWNGVLHPYELFSIRGYHKNFQVTTGGWVTIERFVQILRIQKFMQDKPHKSSVSFKKYIDCFAGFLLIQQR